MTPMSRRPHTQAKHRRRHVLVFLALLNALVLVTLTIGPSALWHRVSTPFFLSQDTQRAWAIESSVANDTSDGVIRISHATITTAEAIEIELTAYVQGAARPLRFGQNTSTSFAEAGWTIVDSIAYEPTLGKQGADGLARTLYRWSWSLEPFLDGRYDIPAITLPISDGTSLEFPAATVEVASLLIDAEAAEPASSLGSYRDTPPTSEANTPAFLDRPIGRFAAGILCTLVLWSLGWALFATGRGSSPAEDFTTLRTKAISLLNDSEQGDHLAACAALRVAIEQGLLEVTGRQFRTLTAADVNSLDIDDPALRTRFEIATRALETRAYAHSPQINTTDQHGSANDLDSVPILRDILDIVTEIHTRATAGRAATTTMHRGTNA